MRTDLVESPPRVSSASEFSLWLCQLHNKVNIKLGQFLPSSNQSAALSLVQIRRITVLLLVDLAIKTELNIL